MNSLTETSIKTSVFDSFETAGLGELWTELLSQNETAGVNLTWEWQRSWWKSFGRGRLLLITAERAGKKAAIAPFFTEGGMIFNLCPEDGLDFVGDISDPLVMDALLETARAQATDFCGFKFYFIPDTSKTGERLKQAAARLGLECHDENNLPSPAPALTGTYEAQAHAAARKKSLLRHENYFRREGTLEVIHLRQGAEIAPHLGEFFIQHITRRKDSGQKSLFEDPAQCDYYRRLSREIGPTGWLRFTRLNWNGRPLSFPFCPCYSKRDLFCISSFDI